MVRPVFSDERRSVEDATTVSRIDRNIEREKEKEKENSNSNMVTREQAEEMANQAATRAVEIATEKASTRRKERDDDDEREGSGAVISSKTVKELQSIAGVFNALKEFSANPLQKAIENKVGDVAAGVVERAFGPPQSEHKKDLIDQILNSQFAASIGAGLGQRGPELINSLTTNFGREKVDGWISGAVGKGGGIPGASPPGTPSGMGGMGGMSGQTQSEMEMILGLDANNPEHVAAYASSQGGMSIDTARKVLRIHQDDFIKQMQSRGVGVNSGSGGNRGSGLGIGNVQEYRGPSPRINDDLIVNTPATEDNKWEKENETVTTIGTQNVGAVETQNIELHPEMEKTKPVTDSSNFEKGHPGDSGVNSGEIATYLKNLNDYVVGLKSAVETQNDIIFKLQSEVETLKRDRTIPDDMLETDINNGKIEKDANVNVNINIKDELEKEGDKSGATIRSLKSIKKGKMED